MKRNLALAIFATTLALTVAGCTDGQTAGLQAYGMKHHIKQFSGGQQVGEWVSTGKVSNEPQSDGYFFEDATTQKIVEVTGTIQVTIE